MFYWCGVRQVRFKNRYRVSDSISHLSDVHMANGIRTQKLSNAGRAHYQLSHRPSW